LNFEPRYAKFTDIAGAVHDVDFEPFESDI